jgi:ATP synthase subunit 6
MYYSPLEQFDIYVIKLCVFSEIYSLTNFTLFLVLIYNLFFFILNNKTNTIKIFYFYNIFYLFVCNLIKENIGLKEYKFIPYLFMLLFTFVFINLIGIIPYSFTLTSHISFTLTFALLTFFMATYLGLVKHKMEFFSLFLPKNTPLMITPFLIIIELVSYVARLFSLAIRLFANMMSGHTLLHILIKFSIILFFLGNIYSIVGLIPLIIVFIVFFLETAIAFLQGYVFSTLFCIYISDGLNLH